MVWEGLYRKFKRKTRKSLKKRQNLCLLIGVSTSWERSKRQSESNSFGKEEEKPEEAEVLERWPDEENFKECQCHKRGLMAHRVKSGKKRKIKEKVNIYK